MSVQLYALAALLSGNELLVPIREKVGRALEPPWMQWGEGKSSCLDRASNPQPLAVQIVALSLYYLSYSSHFQKILSLKITGNIYNFHVHCLVEFVQT